MAATIHRKAWLAALAVIFGAGAALHGQGTQPSPAAPPAIETIQIRPNVYVIFGAGGNVVMHVGEDGVILVNSGSGAMAEQLVAEIRKVTPDPIRLIINTGPGADHIGGNQRVAAEGATINPNAFNAGAENRTGDGATRVPRPEARSVAVIREVKKLIPNKPIRYLGADAAELIPVVMRAHPGPAGAVSA